MKVRILLVLSAIMLITNVAAAQVTLTDEATGASVTLADGWMVLEDEEVAIAVNEEGCLMALAAVPLAAGTAEEIWADIDGFVEEVIENIVIVESGVNDAGDTFIAIGTGTAEGEAVNWMAVGGVDGEYFGLFFAASTESAVTCDAEMGTIIENL